MLVLADELIGRAQEGWKPTGDRRADLRATRLAVHASYGSDPQATLPAARRTTGDAGAGPTGGPDHGDGHGRGFVQLVGGDGVRSEGLGESGGGRTDVAQLRRAQREQQVASFGAQESEPYRRRGDPVDRRQGETGGAGRPDRSDLRERVCGKSLRQHH
ncbi:hypothetical protein [Streptomyces sp. NPDC056255]|uniref:hypothetical protein n=1 Tax=Streptomyces sp. NPDC056255 TaxID=3345764 RepID=UPI0035DBAD27